MWLLMLMVLMVLFLLLLKLVVINGGVCDASVGYLVIFVVFLILFMM